MSIIDALQEVNNTMSTPLTFVYADLNEANATETDKLIDSALPVLIVMQVTPTDKPGASGLLATSFEFNGWFLNKSANITVDYRSIDIESEIIYAMRVLAREFLFKLSQHAIIDPQTNGIQERTYQPIYSSMDANLFGVWVKCTVPVIETNTGCNH